MGGEVRWQVARMTDARPHAHGQEGTATASQPIACTPLSTRPVLKSRG